MTATQLSDAPKGLNDSGKPPETRIGDSLEVQHRVQLLINEDRKGRSQRRAMVKGLVDGNPPYRAGDLRKAGRADACNVNWRTGESYLNNACGAFYDPLSESPTFVTVRTAEGGTRKQKEWSDIITEEFDRLIRVEDIDFDYEMQISIYEMVLYGCGPQLFEDEHSFCSVAIPHRNLLVPEYALSRINKWEECAVLVDYYAHDLYKRIRNDNAAKEMGWNIEPVQEAIKNAMPIQNQGGSLKGWEWHQQQLKNNSFGYSAQSNVIQCAHYFVREFPKSDDDEDGKITHAIVLANQGDQKDHNFLFRDIGRFKNWSFLHPLYYANDGGGYHHSVTGLGVKMFSAMDFQNRLKCNMADKAFAPKVFFKPNSANGAEVLNIIKFGDWAKVPRDFDSVQIPVGSFLEETMALDREMSRTIASNLSQYRQDTKKTDGNPITATQAQLDASNEARLGKTQLNHWYNQLDALFAEKYRRAANASNKLLPGGRASLEFQKRCEKRGVPLKALKNTEIVLATRIIGQGSPFMRQQAMEKLVATSQLNPSPAGRKAIYDDFVASWAGQALVKRYSPDIMDMPQQSDQEALAMLQVSAAKTGVPPVVSPNQTSSVFAQTFMQAMSQALEGLEQGGDPVQVHQFIEALGPATVKHIQAMGEDPRQKQAAKKMEADWKKIAAMHDKLGARIEQMRQKQAEAAAKQQQAQRMAMGQDPELALKAAETRAKMALQKQKSDQAMEIKGRKAAQDMALADAKTSAGIINEDRKARAAESDSTGE